MITAFRTPEGRISLYIALSALIHAAILWFPYIQFHHDRMLPPPLTVRIEHFPKPVEQPAKLPELEHPLTRQDNAVAAKPAAETMGMMQKTAESSGNQKLPRHLRLTYSLYLDGDSLSKAKISHQMDISGDRYILQSVRMSTGISSFKNTDRQILTSRGRIAEHGLQPEIFEEEDIARDSTQHQHATFDLAARKLYFSGGEATALPAETQDILSFMYQLSQLPVLTEYFELPVADVSQLYQYQIEIGVKEDISTPMGKLRALRLRKIHGKDEGYFEIWLALEYRLLPVKFRRVDASGNVIEETSISDIRASDE